MTIVAITSSPQKNANTDFVVKTIGKSAEENGKEVVYFDINSMASRKGCQACDACKKNGGKCVVKDDLTPLVDAVKDAEGVIISSPVYFGQPCGQYRLFEDRLYRFFGVAPENGIAPGKKVAVVTAAGSGGADELADRMCGVLVSFFKFEPVGKIAMVTGNDRKYAESSDEIVAQAKAIGKKL